VVNWLTQFTQEALQALISHPDQLKSGVTRPCRYEPGLQRTYEEYVAARFMWWSASKVRRG
jgi:hypothetical protein